jgi:hypothetical protein
LFEDPFRPAEALLRQRRRHRHEPFRKRSHNNSITHIAEMSKLVQSSTL